MYICTKMMMGSNAPPSRRSPPRPIVQTHTIKNLPPDSGLCVQIPTVIKSTAGFRHFSRSIQAQSEMEKLYFILAGKPLGSDNWWCGHVYLAEDHPTCPPPSPSPGRCRNINLEPGRSPCGSHSSIKPDFITLIALRVCCISQWRTMGQAMWKYPIYSSCSMNQGSCYCSYQNKEMLTLKELIALFFSQNISRPESLYD